MKPSQELLDALWYDKLNQASSMTEKQRLEAGGDLFDYACGITTAGIRHDHPLWTESEILDELRRRLELSSQIESNLAQMEWA